MFDRPTLLSRSIYLTLTLFVFVGMAFAAAWYLYFTPHGYRLRFWEVWELVPIAEKGNINAIGRLRFHYESLEDKERTIYWLRKGAAIGDPESQLVLFDRLKKQHDPALRKEAIDNLQKAVKQGYVNAEQQLATEYLEGSIYPHSNEQAELWFRKAACRGSIDSMRRLSILLTETHSDQKTLAEAFMWTLLGLSHSPKGYEYYFKVQQENILSKARRAGISVLSIKKEGMARVKDAGKMKCAKDTCHKYSSGFSRRNVDIKPDVEPRSDVRPK